MTINRGDIYYAILDGARGSEQGGYRPVLIIQNNIGNQYSPTVIIAPLTTAVKKPLPTHVTFPLAQFNGSTVLLEQIRTLDKSRLREYVGKAGENTMQRVDRALLISLGL